MPLPLWALALGGGALLGSLFGQQDQPDLQQVPLLTPEQQRIAASVADLVGGNLGQPLQGYQGPFTAGPGALQRQAFGALSGALASPLETGGLPGVGAPDLWGLPSLQPGSAIQGQAEQALGRVLAGGLQGLPEVPAYSTGPSQAIQPALSQVLSGTPAYQVSPAETEQFFRTAVSAPAMREFQEEILPSIRESAIGSGTFYSTMRAQEEARAAERLAQGLAARRAEFGLQDIQARRQAAEAAAARQAGALPAALSFALESQAQPTQLALAARGQLAGEQLGLAQALTGAAGQAAALGQIPFQQALAARQQLAGEAFQGAGANLAARQQLFSELLGGRQSLLDTASLAGQLGFQQQQLQTQGMQSAYQEWLRTRPENSPYLQMAMQFLGEPMIGYYQPAQQVSPWATILQTLGQFAPYLALA